MNKKTQTTIEPDIPINETIIDEEFPTLVDDAYMRYTFFVMRDRALPDAEDGLKPSQRRILVAMNDLGLRPGGATEKSAKVVGQTNGDYHPHGDQVIYPTLVRLAQDWVMRYPLILGQGNFGNIGGAPAAAQRYCVTGDTLVATPNGLIPIGEMSPTGDENIHANVFSVGGQTNSASKWFNCGSHPVYRVQTRHGYSITGTANHPLLVIESTEVGPPALKWKVIPELREGDWVVMDRGRGTDHHAVTTLPTPVRRRRATQHKVPHVMNQSLAFVLGALVAEGTLQRNAAGFPNNAGDFAARYLAHLNDAFPSCQPHVFERQPKGWSKQPYVSIETHSAYIVDFLRGIGLKEAKAEKKDTPWSILRANPVCQGQFLSALFEGDGGVAINKDNAVWVCLNTRSEILADQTQTLLLALGIISSRSLDNRGEYKVYVRGQENLVRFEGAVGFVSERKRALLREGISLFSGRARSVMDIVPHLDVFIRKIAHTGHREWAAKNRLNVLDDVPRRIWDAVGSEHHAALESLLGPERFYAQVTGVSDAGQQNVYSVRVDSDCHSFVANGFVNHNTECKLSKNGDFLLADLSPDTVNYVPNYNDKLQEPLLLPSSLPNLIVNGGAGIAVGVATKLAPHNLREIVSVIKAYIDNPAITTDDVLALMPGPDFPTGGILRGQKGVRDYYETGRGSLQIDGVYEIEDFGKGQRIVVTGLPYGSSPNKLSEQIEALVKEGKISGITDLKDLSVRTKAEIKIKVIVDIAKTANASLILNQLLKSTCLRTNFDVNATVLIEGKVVENVPMLKLVEVFVNHRKSVITRKFTAELAKAAVRSHVLDGLLSVAAQIDKAIALIRQADSPDDASAALIAAGMVTSDVQAKAVLGITLSKLTKLETGALAAEKAKIIERSLFLTGVLESDKKMLRIVAKEQEELAKVVGDDRRTQIGVDTSALTTEDLIPEEQVVISLTKDGYIKRIPLSTYRVQARGGKGVIGVKGRDQDEASDIFVASTHDYLLFFTSAGLVYRKKGYEIPQASRTTKGTHLANLLALRGDETVTNTIATKTLDTNGYLVTATRNGLIKRSLIRDYNTRFTNKGLQAIKLQDGDQLAFVEVTDGGRDVFLATANGKAVRYPESSVRKTGRITEGVQAMKLVGGDKIASMLTIPPGENPDILVLTEQGFGKKTNASQYKCYQGRMAMGINTIDKVKADRNGLIIGATTLADEDTLIIMTAKGKVIQIPADSVRQTGRITMGVRVLSIDAGDSIAGFAKVKDGMAEIGGDDE